MPKKLLPNLFRNLAFIKVIDSDPYQAGRMTKYAILQNSIIIYILQHLKFKKKMIFHDRETQLCIFFLTKQVFSFIIEQMLKYVEHMFK